MSAGEFAMPGMPVLEIENTKDLEIVCRLSAVYYEALSDSTELNIEYAGKSLAKVPITFKAPNIDPLTRTFEIKAAVPAENGVISGLLCDVNIVLETREGLGISNKAVIARKNGESVVFLSVGGQAVEQSVKVGLSSEGKIEIIDNSALKDRNIITKGNFYLNDGAPIVEVVE
jgi:multidrug efflux pump subunit AcrA (membrane-fusion protein)